MLKDSTMQLPSELPFISCKCITYGRVETLEESLESFLKQDYPADKCELVIVNDYPLQTLRFDHPQVRIVNVNHTFTTIGAKENFADRKSTRLNSSHIPLSRMPSSA